MRVNCDTGSDHSVAVVAAGICGDEGNAACAINDRLDIITIADAALDVDRQGLIRAVPIGRRRAVCDAAIVYVTDSRKLPAATVPLPLFPALFVAFHELVISALIAAPN